MLGAYALLSKRLPANQLEEMHPPSHIVGDIDPVHTWAPNNSPQQQPAAAALDNNPHQLPADKSPHMYAITSQVWPAAGICQWRL